MCISYISRRQFPRYYIYVHGVRKTENPSTLTEIGASGIDSAAVSPGQISLGAASTTGREAAGARSDPRHRNGAGPKVPLAAGRQDAQRPDEVFRCLNST
jgi:hypothetical protein